MNYTEIKTFEDVLLKAGKELYDVIKPNDDTFISAYKKLCLITKVLNNGWYPKMHEPNQEKYYISFFMKKIFSVDSYYCRYNEIFLPLRLAYVSKDVAKYSSKQFNDIWKAFFEPNTKPNTIIHNVDLVSIKSFDDVLYIANLSEQDIIEDDDPEHIKALKRYILICKVLNNGWNPDFNNKDEQIHYPYFKVYSEGVSSDSTHSFTFNDDGLSLVSLRFCFKDRKTASFAGSKFISIIQPYIEYNLRKENILEILK